MLSESAPPHLDMWMGNLDALALVLMLGLRGLAGTGVLDADPWRPEGESVRRTCRSERQAMLCSVETCLLAVWVTFERGDRDLAVTP